MQQLPDPAERIAAAIAAEYPNEPQPEQLAKQLAAVAAQQRISDLDISLWITDRPRHELSTSHLLKWRDRYKL